MSTAETSDLEALLPRFGLSAFRPGQRDQRAIHYEIWVKDDHFVAGIERGQHSQHQPAAR